MTKEERKIQEWEKTDIKQKQLFDDLCGQKFLKMCNYLWESEKDVTSALQTPVNYLLYLKRARIFMLIKHKQVYRSLYKNSTRPYINNYNDCEKV
jgi:hypothetical protein